MTTSLFIASTTAQSPHGVVHARCVKAQVVRPAPGGTVDG
jgi:hypothetical protein